MDGVRSVKNQYLGINAHLHSHWQTVGGWSDFHSAHIGDISKTLKAQLLPMGYTTEIEQSLQIRRVDDSRDWPESDITIYDLLRNRPPNQELPHPLETGAATVVLPLPLMVEENLVSEKPYGAIAVYEYIPRKRDRGEPVVWIELLSPANKGRGTDGAKYIEKRRTILESGIVFVEIDYLHETPSTFARLPRYSNGEHNGHDEHGQTKHGTHQPAHPYRIVVLDPRPDLQNGKVYLDEFDVDAPIPTVPIPLNGTDLLRFDFGVPYRKTFEEELYGLEFVNYRELPQRLQRYSEEDQTRIAARMLAVLEAAQAHVDLETGPFPAEPVPLETALAELKTHDVQ
ncbi:MAG: DUF4058 family protein [Caldilineaceae bacterium]|nr:DUF4058 family protein [Caldilineaceae bacterium]